MELETIELLAIVFGPGGATFVGLRMALNGMKGDMKEIKRDLRDVRDGVKALNQRGEM